tara:strand:- start:1110 stop:1301 length:192 start_codon:yes stop_codon:yes gene_type:complete
MNSTIGIEYAYARIHKLEVEALDYKDKISELQKDISFLQSCVNSGEYAEVKDRPSNKSIGGAE